MKWEKYIKVYRTVTLAPKKNHIRLKPNEPGLQNGPDHKDSDRSLETETEGIIIRLMHTHKHISIYTFSSRIDLCVDPNKLRKSKHGPKKDSDARFIYTSEPTHIRVDKADFAAIVQKLTGKTPPPSPSLPSREQSPASSSQFAAVENNGNRAIQRPTTPPAILSPGPSFSPVASDFFDGVFSAAATHPQGSSSTHPQDVYWNEQGQYQPPVFYGGSPKRDRFDFGQDMQSYLQWDKDLSSIPDSDYDLYLQSVTQNPYSLLPSEQVGLFDCVGGNNMMMPSHTGPSGMFMGFGQQDLVRMPVEESLSLPVDASNTLFVEGVPLGCSKREVAHIFRRFRGYKEVRLVTRNSNQLNGDPIVLCFVDFENPAFATTALNALQGYQMDELDPGSNILRIQFSRNTDPRRGGR